MMEVYEVMLFALPLWVGLVGMVFGMVFGRDVIAHFWKSGQNRVTATAQTSNRAGIDASYDPHFEEPAPRKGESELVLH